MAPLLPHDWRELATPGSPPQKRAAIAAAMTVGLLLFLATGREAAIASIDANDSAFHLALAKRAEEAIRAGDSPLDYWFAEVGLGFPVFRHYQHLPHLALVTVHRVLGGAIGLEALYRWSVPALLALFPVAICGALLHLRTHPLMAASSAALAPLVSTPDLYGLGLESYLWAGRGLYAQIVASVLAPVAFAYGYSSVRTGRRLLLAALLIAATFLSQLIYGYVIAISITAALAGPIAGFRLRVARLALLMTAAFLAASYFFVPAILEAQYVNHSIWEDAFKWNSLGARTVVGHLVGGTLFDFGRPPAMTALAALGAAVALWRGPATVRVFGALAVCWLLLYFGRPTWGAAMNVLPFAAELPLHRLIGAVHLFSIPLAGYGLALLVAATARQRGALRAAGCIALILAFGAVVRERMTYVKWSEKLKQRSASVIRADPDVAPLFSYLATLAGGRVYVGIPRAAGEFVRVGDVPLSAFALAAGLDTVGFLFHAMSVAGDVQLLFDANSEVLCRLFGVRYLVFTGDREPPPFAKPLHTIGRFRVYEVPSASYFAVGDAPGPIAHPKSAAFSAARAWMTSGLPERNVFPVLEYQERGVGDRDAPAEALNRLTSSPTPPGIVVQQRNTWSADVRLTRAAAVILKVNYHPRLRATVDGRAAPVLRTAPSFAAVAVPAGDHRVSFTYDEGIPAAALAGGIAGAALLLRFTRALTRA